jgi:mRNA-degrading endonuclease RelE of RelBE toxin-antitoxin system
MNYKVIPTEYFKQQVRLLQKDYPHIRHDLKELHKMLIADPKCGKALGKKVYKIRLKNSDIVKGKRSGYRVISYVVDEDAKIRLLTIYAKSRKIDISDEEILLILRKEGLI